MRFRLPSILIGVAFASASGACAESAQLVQRREAGYQVQLAAYTAALKPGTTRTEVEAYLRTNGKEFHQTCCMGKWKNAYDDLTKIGQERHPWYCSAHTVYIGFEFVSGGSHEFPEAHDSDTLKGIQIYHRLEGCL